MLFSFLWTTLPLKLSFYLDHGGASAPPPEPTPEKPKPKPKPRVTLAESQASWQPGWNVDNPPPASGWYETRCLAYSPSVAHYYWDADTEGGIWRVGGPPESLPEDNGSAKLSGLAEYRGPVPYNKKWAI